MTRVPHVKCSKCNYFYNVNFRFIQINYVGVIIKHFNKRIVNVKLIHIIQIQNYFKFSGVRKIFNYNIWKVKLNTRRMLYNKIN